MKVRKQKQREKTGFVMRNVPSRVKESQGVLNLHLILLLSVFLFDMVTSQSNTNPPQKPAPRREEREERSKQGRNEEDEVMTEKAVKLLN